MQKASNCGVMTLGACSLKVIMPQFVVLQGNIPSQHNSQTTLPRRGSSQEFTEHKKERAQLEVPPKDSTQNLWGTSVYAPPLAKEGMGRTVNIIGAIGSRLPLAFQKQVL